MTHDFQCVITPEAILHNTVTVTPVLNNPLPEYQTSTSIIIFIILYVQHLYLYHIIDNNTFILLIYHIVSLK